MHSGFGDLRVLPLSTQVRRFKTGRSRQDFSGRKNPQHVFHWKGSKAVGPMSYICGIWMIPELTWKLRSEAKFLVNSSPHSSTFRYQDLLRHAGTWGHLSANVGTSKHAGGNRVSTISLLGCSTSMALTMGPTDKEEEEEWRVGFHMPGLFHFYLCNFYPLP